MSDKKEKLEKENIESEENKLNGDSVDQAVADDSETDETIGTPSYEELFDKNEELEKLLLRANADLDNALKSYQTKKNLPVPKVNQPIRIALTGSTKSPSLGLTLSIFGKELSIKRIEDLITHLNQ